MPIFFAAAGLTIIDGLGVDGEHLHCDRESCRLSSIVRRTQLVVLFLLRLADGTISPLKRRISP